MAASFTLPTVLANLTAGNQALSLIDGDLTTLRDPLLSLNTFSNYFTDAGAANAYSITVSSPQTLTQSAGLLVQFMAAHANTGASTLQINALAVKNIKNQNGSALSAAQIPANAVVTVIYDGTNYQLQSAAVAQQPTQQVLTSGSGATYTTPAGATRILVRMVGGGGGGGAATTNSGTAGGNTTFSTLTAGGGNGGGAAGTPSAGGTATGGDINAPGAPGGSGGNNLSTIVIGGGHGGSSYFGGGGAGGFGGAGAAAAANSGGGGGGGGTSAASCGGGGASGAFCQKLFIAPAATFTYTIGAVGTGGAAGGLAGGNGGTGLIVVDEFYD